VPSSKVAVFRVLQNFQTVFQRFQPALAGKMRLYSIKSW
jgi:hypothetical protein